MDCVGNFQYLQGRNIHLDKYRVCRNLEGRSNQLGISCIKYKLSSHELLNRFHLGMDITYHEVFQLGSNNQVHISPSFWYNPIRQFQVHKLILLGKDHICQYS